MTTSPQTRPQGWTPDLNTFGARLALLRQAMGWGNVAEAANQCSIPVASWRNWERDNREPRGLVNVALKIAGVTGVDHRWLIEGPTGVEPIASEAVHATRQYQPGERVIAVGGMPDRGTRTRPLIRPRSSEAGRLTSLKVA
jgi:transcriptional regulator with XRE-family HTH domain